ncbi:hypothetical protein KIN20_029960 [Parelaphostrongylus tenuis]|uniref:DBP10 C-terminal domain-containing protein n=1 Tax=Parelaphostrongylus tenuis TaxID=148309 RepID=A0AAD5WFT6_PARTN|nr:hypothetical protein KIN20_029960 [Parelaphostrongylus tenuis]
MIRGIPSFCSFLSSSRSLPDDISVTGAGYGVNDKSEFTEYLKEELLLSAVSYYLIGVPQITYHSPKQDTIMIRGIPSFCSFLSSSRSLPDDISVTGAGYGVNDKSEFTEYLKEELLLSAVSYYLIGVPQITYHSPKQDTKLVHHYIFYVFLRDRKKNRLLEVVHGDVIKRIRTEDGTWLPASYKTGRYEDWKKKQKIGYKKNGEDEQRDDEEATHRMGNICRQDRWKKHNNKHRSKGAKLEIRNVSQIKKIRKKSIKLQDYMEHRRLENLKKKAARMGGGGKKGFGKKRGSRHRCSVRLLGVGHVSPSNGLISCSARLS